jgi:LytS/YehU family sensor histidine kinase
MENKFDYKIEFGEGVEEEDIIIPSMLIQPYVENSIWHGISPLDGKGDIRILFSMHSADSLKIIIEDNGIGIKQSANYSSTSETHLHLSMEIIRKRLEIIGKKMRVVTSVEITEAFPGNPNPGTRVTLVVPVSYKT